MENASTESDPITLYSADKDYAPADFIEPNSDDNIVPRKLAAIGQKRLRRSTEYWKQEIKAVESDVKASIGPSKSQDLDLPKDANEARLDLIFGLQCMAYLPTASSKHKESSRLSQKRRYHIPQLEETFPPSTDAKGNWRQEVFQAIHKLQELLSASIDSGYDQDISKLLLQFDATLVLLEDRTPVTIDNRSIWDSVTSFLTYTTLCSQWCSWRKDSTQEADILVRCATLCIELEPESPYFHALGKALAGASWVHLIKLQDTKGASGNYHLDTAFEYFARLTSLDPTAYKLEFARNLAICGESKMSAARNKCQALKEIISAIDWSSFSMDIPSGSDIFSHYLKSEMIPPLIQGGKQFQEEREEVDFAIDCLTWSVELASENDPQLPAYLTTLVTNLETRRAAFNLEGITELDKAIEYQTRAVLLTPGAHSNYDERAQKLANLLARRLDLGLKSVEAVDKILGLIQLQTKSRDRVSISEQFTVATAFELRFNMTGAGEDIDQAIETLSTAISSFPRDYPQLHRAQILGKLSSLYRKRFLRFSKLIDIDNAIEICNQASSLQLEGQGARHPMLLDLMLLHRIRREHLGDPRDKRIGNEYMKELRSDHSATNTYLDTNPDKQLYFRRLLDRLPDLINIIIESSTPHDLSPDYSECLNTIIDYGRSLLSGSGDNPLDLAVLSRLLFERYLSTNEGIDCKEAIEYMENAVSVNPQGYSEVPTWLYELACFYYCRLERDRAPEDYKRAIKCANQALTLLSDTQATRPDCLYLLARIYAHGRILAVEDENDQLEQVLLCLQAATRCVGGNPMVLYTAASAQVRIATLNENYELASEAFTAAMAIAHKVIWLSDTISRRFAQWCSPMVGSLAGDAAAVAINSQKHSVALEWLEQGRSVIWNQTLQLRTPLDELQRVKPTLADRLKQLSTELQLDSRASQGGMSRELLESAAQKHRRATEEYSRLIDQIRSIPGFNDFLRPRPASDLLQAARSGPIIVVNIATSRCDALVLIPGCSDVRHIALPKVSAEAVEEIHENMSRSFRGQGLRSRAVRPLGAVREDADQALEKVLGSLWTLIASPVLEYLGYLENPPAEPLPRLTWCTTGRLSMLPLHAAGFYDRPNSKTSDFVVSSYTPTLSALLSALSTPPAPHSQLLAISQENNSLHNLCLLPGTKKELAFIETHTKEPIDFNRIEESDASCELVLEAMEQSDWVHLACHAKQDPKEPTESGFFLADGVLTLETIIRKSFEDKGLAFLSACQTAKGDEKLVDEAVHLAAGMLLAGYRSVIATMWSVSDTSAPEITNGVYQRLLKDGKMDHTESARALHEAVNALRESIGYKKFIHWVPYIHIGA
ncbi:Dynein heavy chain 2, axonemal [Rhizoctonia solani]|uniref:Dynein heavy chain 2, axonemal n=1 Tax=Rhizoctonia solani TaxID=456999 RepID=A0A0K6FZB4_9AGAM|nr:Dynein heavy chain 2, axonemal [Rhizoctonia solani]